MGLEEVLGVNEVLDSTNSSILDFLPADMVSQIGSLITLLKITGIVIIGYLVFLFIKWIFGIKRYRKINKIYEKIEEIDRKLNVLIRKKGVKKEVVEEKDSKKKRGLIRRLFRRKRKVKKK